MMESKILNGFKCYFRLITPSDKHIYLDAFNKLSMSTKKYRFHQFRKSLTEKEINYFLDIDNHDHLAIGATIKIENKEYGVGIIRYIRDEKKSDCAEVALTIVDSFQHNGLGTELYEQLLILAKKNGIRILSNHVLNENNLVIKLLDKFNGISKENYKGTCVINVPVFNL